MTPRERKIAFANHQKRLENSRSGTRRVLVQHGHQEVFADGRRAQRELSADDPGSGFVPGQSGRDLNDVIGDITTASGYVEIAIANTSDDGLADGLRAVLATLNALSKVPAGSLVPKGKVNVGGTEGSRFVPSNKASSTGSSDRWVNVADLADSPALVRLLKKYPKIADQYNATNS